MPKINQLQLEVIVKANNNKDFIVGSDRLIDFHPGFIDGKDILCLELRNVVTDLVKELAKQGYEF